MTVMVITAGNLAVGDIIIVGNAYILVERITPCTQRGKIHVNTSLCYDNTSTVEIIRKDH